MELFTFITILNIEQLQFIKSFIYLYRVIGHTQRKELTKSMWPHSGVVLYWVGKTALKRDKFTLQLVFGLFDFDKWSVTATLKWLKCVYKNYIYVCLFQQKTYKFEGKPTVLSKIKMSGLMPFVHNYNIYNNFSNAILPLEGKSCLKQDYV